MMSWSSSTRDLLSQCSARACHASSHSSRSKSANNTMKLTHFFITSNIHYRQLLLTSLCPASYISWQHDTARICCWTVCCYAPCCRSTRQMPLEIDISCPPGPQKQTRSSDVQQSTDGTDRQDRQIPYHYTDPAENYVSSVNKLWY